jgi:hypothetical protein
MEFFSHLITIGDFKSGEKIPGAGYDWRRMTIALTTLFALN